jgi:biopolymer transport protein ExbD
MGKIKIKRKSTTLDMTAMCDVAFLLLTFFMLTTKFRPPEPLTVDIPSSIVSTPIPTKDMAVISVGKDGRVFLDVDQQQVRVQALNLMGEKYNIKFSAAQQALFANIGPFGAPMGNLTQLLDAPSEERDALASKMPGIGLDTTEGFSKCELMDWVLTLRRIKQSNGGSLKVAIKGDMKTQYPAVKTVMDILQKQNVNQFSLITNLEANPLAKK